MLGSSQTAGQHGQMQSNADEPRMMPANSLLSGFGGNYPSALGEGATGTTPRNDLGGLLMNR